MLVELAEARQASVSKETLVLYPKRLSEFELPELRAVIDEMSLEKPKKGETAFPALGDIAERLRARKARRRAVDEKGAALKELDKHFWIWVTEQSEIAGMTEQEFLDTVKTPGYAGRKARVNGDPRRDNL
jgi:hypothetical protein